MLSTEKREGENTQGDDLLIVRARNIYLLCAKWISVLGNGLVSGWVGRIPPKNTQIRHLGHPHCLLAEISVCENAHLVSKGTFSTESYDPEGFEENA